MHQFDTERVSFDSDGSRVAGVLYRPVGIAAPMPCVVMAHGFSGTMDWIVPDFAATFAGGGLAVLIFDYRHLGVSEGEPRQLITTGRQRADLRRAVEFARSHPHIDANRITLWGTSLGGAYVIALAAQDPAIAAVVANVPGLDMFAGTRGRYVPPQIRPGPISSVELSATRPRGKTVSPQGSCSPHPATVTVRWNASRHR